MVTEMGVEKRVDEVVYGDGDVVVTEMIVMEKGDL